MAMLERPATRRRVIALIGAVSLLPAAGLARAAPALEWRGTAMGADASITLHGERRAAEAALAAVRDEIERLERVLGLFRSESELVRLNRDGRIDRPAQDLVACLALAGRVHRLTAGGFDPTVQVLFEAHAQWFADRADGTEPPPDSVLRAARERVGFSRVRIGLDRIELEPGTRLTLNGIAQGWATDRAAEILRAHGFRSVLVDLGELRALGPKPDGAPWRAALEGGGAAELREGALAVSAPDGLRFRGGPWHHLFDPRTGRSASHWRRVVVAAPSAALADGLSTGLAATGPDAIGDLVRGISGVTVRARDMDGRETVFHGAAGA